MQLGLIDELIEKIEALNAPVCVGIDPRLEDIPQEIKIGKTTAEAFLAYGKQIIDAVKELVPAIKPQIAMYEMLGWVGIKAYEETISYAKKSGLIVILDVKRGDIGSTAENYAVGYLGENQAYHADFITLNPYLGTDSLAPFVESCEKNDKGVFILVKTSNPGSADIQDIIATDNQPIYQHVAHMVSQLGENSIGKYGFSPVGAVVGATHGQLSEKIREMMPHTFFLVPGYGAQGGSVANIKPLFKNKKGLIVNSSRGIIAAWKQEKYKNKSFQEATKQATLEMIEDLRGIL